MKMKKKQNKPDKTSKHPTKKEEKKILDFLQQMQWMFGLQNYDRNIEFVKEAHKDRAASIEIDEEYQRIKIKTYPQFFEHTKKDQRVFLLHEFCHYLTDSISEVAYQLHIGNFETDKNRKDACEKSTSQIVNILDKFLTDKLSFAKKEYKKYLV